jgi:hypothetical protein
MDDYIAKSDLENISEVQVFEIRHVQESLLHFNLGHNACLRIGYF